MKKVLIISYFSPPCNLTSANRINSWVKYLPEYEVYPILITRNWTGKELTEEQRLKSSGSKKNLVKNQNSEIHYMPYKASLRDQFFIKGKQNKLAAYLSKALTLINLIFQNFSLKFIPYNNLYYEARKLLKEDKELNTIIISGNPFEQFYFGYLLKKEFPNIKWIADYRDEWTTNYLYNSLKSKNFIIKALEKYSEKKWLKYADKIQTVCSYFGDRLEKIHQSELAIVPNGFDTEIVEQKNQSEFKPVYLLYAGTLYPNQEVEIFLKSLLNFTREEIIIHFVGAKFNSNKNLIEQLKTNGVLLIDEWIEQTEIQELKLKVDGFLMFPFKNMKGWPSSKLYDYLPYQKPILLCPSDNDIIEDILLDTGLGLIVNDEETLVKTFKKLIQLKKEGKELINVNTFNINKYSRKEATFALAEIIKTHI